MAQLGQPVFLLHNGTLPKHADRLKAEFPDIVHLTLEKNRSYSGGVNYGLESLFLRGFDWVFILTNDCVIEKLQLPGSSPALIAPRVYRRKKPHIDSIGASFEPRIMHLWHQKTELDFANLTEQPRTHRVARIPYVPGSAFWIHREIFATVGAFDELLGIYWDDVDFSARCFFLGGRIFADIRTEILHGVSKTTAKDTMYTTYLFQRNKGIVCKRYVTGIWPRVQLELRLLAGALIRATRFLIRRDTIRFRWTLRAWIES